jgi:hypothetical protein
MKNQERGGSEETKRTDLYSVSLEIWFLHHIKIFLGRSQKRMLLLLTILLLSFRHATMLTWYHQYTLVTFKKAVYIQGVS